MISQFHFRAILLSSVGILSASPGWATNYPVAAGTTSTTQISAGGTDKVTVDGTLSVNDTAIKWNSASTGLQIINNGTIASTATGGRAINAGGNPTAPRVLTLINGSNGLITSQDDAIRINVDITQGSVNLTNAGTIVSTVSGQAIDFDAVSSTAAGAIMITNLASGTIRSSDADAIRPGEGAAIDNYGTITAGAVTNTSSDGIDFQSHSGTVVNEVGGTITGARHGITTHGDVNVTNYGAIIGSNGSGVGSDGTGTVYNYGTITGAYNGSGTGDGDGVDIDGVGYVYNNGTIQGTGAAGVGADGGANASEGVALTAGGTVYNDTKGVITGADVGITAWSAGTDVYTITNKGSIYGGNHGIGFTGVGTIVNYGTIGAGGYAIDVLAADNTDTSVSIDNYGTIGGSYGSLYIQAGTAVSLAIESGSSLKGLITLDGTLDVNTKSDYTFSDVISGAGSLTKSGAATLTLTGANLYTGGTTVSAGTLRGSTTSLQGAILDNATVEFAQDTAGTYGGAISGSGALVKSGAGVLTLSGSDSYTGGTTVAGGTLALSGTGTLGASSGATTVSGGTLDLGGTSQTQNGGVTLVGGTIQNGTLSSSTGFALAGGSVSAVLTGAGGVVQASGTTTLTGANTFSGGTTISGGTLALSGAGTLGASGNATTVNSGTLDLGGTSQAQNGGVTLAGGTIQNGTLSSATGFALSGGSVSAVLAGTGGVVQVGGTTILTGANTYTGGTTVSGGTLRGSTISLQGPILDNATVEFAQDTAGSYSGAITGSGSLVKSGSGALSLTGASAIAGATTVAGGTLAINGTLATGGLTVTSGATLGGSGTITGAVTIANGATLSPGNSPGTLAVNGNLTLASGANTVIDIDGAAWSAAGGAGSYDRLIVNGIFTAAGTLTTQLRGISGAATNTYVPTIGTRYTIVTASAVTGTFASVVQPTAGLDALTRLDPLYSANTVQLVLTPKSFATLGAASGWNANTLAVAGALDAVRSSSGSTTLFNNLYGLDTAGYGLSFSQMSGQVYADALQGFASAAHGTLSLVREQALRDDVIDPRTGTGAQIWTRFLHTRENPGDSGLGNAYAATTDGFVAGVNLISEPALRFGVAGGYTHTRINTGLGASAGGSGEVGYVYGAYTPGPVFALTVVGGVANVTLNTSRAITTENGRVSADGSAHSFMTQFAVDGRLRALQRGGLALFGVAGIEAGITRSSQISESASNSAFALTLPRSDWNIVDGRLGGEAIQHFKGVSLSAYGHWLVQLGDAATASRQVVLGETNWTVRSTGLAKSGVGYGAAIGAQITQRLSLQASYDGGDRGKGYHSDRISAGVSMTF